MTALRRRAPLLLLTLVLLLLPLRGSADAVLVVTGERGGAYDETIAALRRQIALEAADPPTITDIDAKDYPGRPLDATRMVVTVGARAAQTVAQRSAPVPVLNILLPRVVFEAQPDLSGSAAADHSAIFLDQSPARQIAAISEALPAWRRIALIYSPQTADLAAELARTARSAGFEVAEAAIDSERELYTAMQDALVEPTVLIAVPDRQLFNSHTIQNILLTSFRKRSPVFGFSPAYVRAGAVLGLYSTPAQIAAEAAVDVVATLDGGRLPRPRHPATFTIDINPTVARALGIVLDDSEAIAARIQERETAR